MIDILNTIGVVIGAAGAFFFPVYYHRIARWWKTGMGQHIMGFSLVMALLYMSGLLRMLELPEPFYEGFRVVLIWACAVVVWWRIIVFRQGHINSLRKITDLTERQKGTVDDKPHT